MYMDMRLIGLPMGVLDMPDEQPVEPYGCHWFRDCGLCRWETCVVDGWPETYDSHRGRQLRSMGYAGLRLLGIGTDWLAAFFGVSTEQVLDEIRQYGRMIEAVERRRMGETEAQAAVAVGVSVRHLRRWCQCVPGIVRVRSKTAPSRGGYDYGLLGRADMSLEQRAAWVRGWACTV